MASAPGPLPWLRLGGVEVGNAARAMEYMRTIQGMAGKFEVLEEYPCDVLYTEHGTTPFVDVSTDPAPWYNATEVRSTYFRGFVPGRITGTQETTIVRGVGARFGGIEGGKLGPQHRNFRPITVRGWLVGVGGIGLDYGLRWLNDILASSSCETCSRQTLEVYNACPDGLGTLGKYLIYDVGLTGGPRPVGDPVWGSGCDFLEIEFTLAAENPFLYTAPTLALAEEVVGAAAVCEDPDEHFLLGDPGDPHCAVVPPPAVGVIGSIITITAPSGVGGLQCGYFNSCPPAPEDVPEKVIYVDRLYPGETLVIDSSRRRIVLNEVVPATPGTLCGGLPCDDTELSLDGTSRLHFEDGKAIEWLDVASCDLVDGCFCVRTTHPCSGGEDATVQIEIQHRVG